MEITEKERLILVEKKEEICGLTLWILDNANEPQNSVQIKTNMTMILSLLSTIASYANSKNYNMDGFKKIADETFVNLNQPLAYLEKMKKDKPILWKNDIVFRIELFCNYANSVRFDFTKKGLKIHFPKINLNFGNITNK